MTLEKNPRFQMGWNGTRLHVKYHYESEGREDGQTTLKNAIETRDVLDQLSQLQTLGLCLN